MKPMRVRIASASDFEAALMQQRNCQRHEADSDASEILRAQGIISMPFFRYKMAAVSQNQNTQGLKNRSASLLAL